MANLDDVISELRIAIKDFTENQLVYETGDDNVIISITTLEQALALLEAQEPRVMTLEEVMDYLADPDGDKKPLWLEWSTIPSLSGWVLPSQVADLMKRYLKSYNTKWRPWTSRPTDAQREATCWEHNILTQKENENG